LEKADDLGKLLSASLNLGDFDFVLIHPGILSVGTGLAIWRSFAASASAAVYQNQSI